MCTQNVIHLMTLDETADLKLGLSSPGFKG